MQIASAAPPATVPAASGARRAHGGGRRSNRRRRPHPPDQLVVWEIFVRLPAKALLRCSAVCRSWRRLASAADFLLAHNQRQPSLPLVCFHGMIRGYSDVVNAAVEAFYLREAPATAERCPVLRFSDSGHRREFKVYASCDGLLLLSVSNGGFLNHRRRYEYAALEYHFLNRRRYGYPVLDSAYYILTVGFSAGARCIGLPAASPCIEQYISAGMRYVSDSEHPPVMHRNCLHWVLHSSEEKALVVFDTVAESFRRMCSPAAGNWRSSAHLLEMDGKLGFSKIDESKMVLKLWVLQDYETEVWSLKYQIKIPIENEEYC